MTEHVQTRAKVRQIPRVSTFNALLEECTISQEEKELMRLHYLENKDFCYIGDQLGYSEITMKRWHKKILRKLNKVL
jgi:DNA-directed RNA polymerase specialized sigma subunit|nr:MAG TPA: ECF sigma factor [Caudoviricetes sp.]